MRTFGGNKGTHTKKPWMSRKSLIDAPKKMLAFLNSGEFKVGNSVIVQEINPSALMLMSA